MGQDNAGQNNAGQDSAGQNNAGQGSAGQDSAGQGSAAGGRDGRDPRPRAAYPAAHGITTRWHDNDIYGHVNNVVYYSFFDTAVNRFLIDRGVLDIHGGAEIGLVVETGCRYFQPLAFPDDVTAGIGVAHLGRSSVRYEIGLFRAGEDLPAAEGFFVHVYVDRQTRRPAPLSDGLRAALAAIQFR
nr:thioesterase family protein [Eilatimonas milleporae]